MSKQRFQTLFIAITACLALWLGSKYLLPLALPFLLGLLLALAAEPAVRLLRPLLTRHPGIAVFLGVTATILLLTVLLTLLISLLVRELGHLAKVLPDLEQTARQGLAALENWLLGLAMASPQEIRPLLTRGILDLFDSGSDLYDRAIAQLPRVATGVLSHMSDSFLFFGTGLLSSYLISARIPQLHSWLRKRLPRNWSGRWLPAIRSLKTSLSGWFRAQLMLMCLTFVLVCSGLLLLGIPYAFVWALLITLIDAVPMLGTGLVLIPWSLTCFLGGNHLRGMGMLGLFAAATLARTTLEPKLLGRQLGLDPLVTLIALYLGYRLFGFPGLLFSPLFAVTLVQILNTQQEDKL